MLQIDLYDCSFIFINDSLSKLRICQLTSKQKTQINSEEVLPWIERNTVAQPKDKMLWSSYFRVPDIWAEGETQKSTGITVLVSLKF